MADNALLRSQPPFPEKVGKYELLLPIGTGGMATVYLARSSGVGGFERDVALKLVHAHLRTDEDSKLQLLEEAKLAARIRHPNVVPVLEIDEDPLGLFLVMDYVEGDTLSGLSRLCRSAGKALPLPLIGRILNDALLGLHAAHELTDERGKPLNLVHRDFSPQNILVSVQGITRLADFGVAKAADRAVRTKTGLVKGKIAYMSPEQARGQAIDRRCDVWAAGVVAWELLAGRRMHHSDDDVATLLSIVTEDPPRLCDVVPHIPKALSDVVASAVCPDVSRRCPTAEDLRKSLVKAFEESGGVADAQDLAKFVQHMVGPKLHERGAAVSEVRTLRRRMDELARARTDEQSDAEAAGPPEPRSSPTRSLGPGRAVAGGAAPSKPRPVASAGLAAVSAHPPDIGPFPQEELTQTSAVVAVFQAVRRDRRRAIIGAVAGLCLVAALGLAFAELASESPAQRATSTAARSVAEAAAQPSASEDSASEGSDFEGASQAPPRGVGGASAASKDGSEIVDAEGVAQDSEGDNVDGDAKRGSSKSSGQRPARSPKPAPPPTKTKSRKPKLADSPYVSPESNE